MSSNYFILLCLALFPLISMKTPSSLGKTETEARIFYTPRNEWEIVTSDFRDDVNYVATAIYVEMSEEHGWDTLHITTNGMYSDLLQAEAAGRLEGYLTREKIYTHYQNLFSVRGALDDKVRNHFQIHEDFMEEIYRTNKEDAQVYNVYLVYTQFKAMRTQYNLSVNETAKIDEIEFYMMPAFGDLMEIEGIYKERKKFSEMTAEELKMYYFLNSHCSALFKAKEDFSNVFLTHNSWYYYGMMTRIFKEYNFNFNHPSVKAKNIMFSSYAATLSSNDDFYVTSQDLSVIETTNIIYNDTLYTLMKPESFMTWQRVMAANRMSATAEEWGDNFKGYNSGTYNNMYMALDMKKLDLVNRTIADKALFTIEQIPDLVAVNDVTEYLRYGYWPSYNTPFDPEIIKISMIKEAIEKNPSLASQMDYDTCTRANIFRRDQGKVVDMDSLKRMIRYNNYTLDPLTLGDPTASISARGDLRAGKESCYGAYDAKAAQVSELIGENKTIHVVAGPAWDDVEPFVFSKAESCAKFKHIGMKDEYKYDWFTVTNKYKMKDY